MTVGCIASVLTPAVVVHSSYAAAAMGVRLPYGLRSSKYSGFGNCFGIHTPLYAGFSIFFAFHGPLYSGFAIVGASHSGFLGNRIHHQILRIKLSFLAPSIHHRKQRINAWHAPSTNSTKLDIFQENTNRCCI